MNRREFESKAPGLRARILAMVGRLAPDEAAFLAEDVAQDTLMRLWMMRQSLDKYDSVDSLALVVARHLTIDALRHSGRLSRIPDSYDSADSSPGVQEALEEAELSAEVRQVIGSLPSVQQTVLRLRHHEGMEIAEIAAITGSSPGAVRTALSRARQNIRDIFASRNK